MHNQRLASAGIADIAAKLDTGERLSFEDGVRLFGCPDLQLVGALANREREKRHAAEVGAARGKTKPAAK